MKKRLTALFLALCLVMSIVVLPASAVEISNGFKNDVNDVLGVYADYYDQIGAFWVYLNEYLEGSMSYDAFTSKTNALLFDIDDEADRNSLHQLFYGLGQSLKGINYAGANTTAAIVQGVRECIDGLGDGFSGLVDFFNSVWDKFCNKNGYTTSDVDMQGYNVVLKEYSKVSRYSDKLYLSVVYYGNKGIFSDRHFDSLGNDIISVSISYDRFDVYDTSGDLLRSDTSSNSIFFWHYFGSTNNEYLGNWIFEDDEDYSGDLIIDSGESSLSPDDLPEDTDLTDFLKDLLEKLMNAFPDTSTIEGLLRAILAKCTSIDERISEQGGGMTASELNTLLDEAILKITLQNQVNDTAMLNELISIRKILQGFDDDEVIDDDTSNSILEGLISGITSGLINFIGINADVSDLVDACKDAGTLGIKLLSGIVDIIAFLSAAVPYNIIKTLLTSVFGIMFNESTPVDLTFTIDSTSYTLLSTSFLSIPVVAGALNIVKGVVTVIIVFSWLKWARKFYLSLL